MESKKRKLFTHDLFEEECNDGGNASGSLDEKYPTELCCVSKIRKLSQFYTN